MRGFFSLVLCVSMLLMSVPFAGATDGSEADTVLNESAMDAYVQSVLPHYLSLENDNVYGEIAVSQGYVVHGHNDPNARTYFVTDDGDYIANLFVTYINGQYSSNFGFDDNADVDAALSGGTPMALVAESEMLILQTAAGNALLTEGDSGALLSRSIAAYPRVVPLMQETSIKNSDVTAAKHVSTRSEDFSVGLNVPYVANDYYLIDPTKPDTLSNRKYLCWAASVAMICQYRTGVSYTAMNIYNAMVNLYGGTPVGENIWYTRAYSHCGMTATHVSSAMNATAAYVQMDTYDKPIIVRMINGNVKHAIVLRYISKSGTSLTYGFRDPNYNSLRYGTGTTGGSFSYNGGSITYTTWYASVY